MLRHILCLSPLIKEYKTKIELTAKGRKLLDADKFGEIYLALLQSAFRKFNWGFIDYSEECPLQQQVAEVIVLQSAVAPELEIIDEAFYASLSAMIPALDDEPVTTSQWTAPTPNHARILHFRRRYVYVFGLLGLWTHSATRQSFSRSRATASSGDTFVPKFDCGRGLSLYLNHFRQVVVKNYDKSKVVFFLV